MHPNCGLIYSYVKGKIISTTILFFDYAEGTLEWGVSIRETCQFTISARAVTYVTVIVTYFLCEICLSTHLLVTSLICYFMSVALRLLPLVTLPLRLWLFQEFPVFFIVHFSHTRSSLDLSYISSLTP